MTSTAKTDTTAPRKTPRRPLVGLIEIRDLLVNISKEWVQELTFRSDFPAPFADLAEGNVWLREDVDAWIDEHREAVAAMLVGDCLPLDDTLIQTE